MSPFAITLYLICFPVLFVAPILIHSLSSDDPILSSEDCGPDCFAVFGYHKRIVSQSDMSSWRNAVKDKVHKERSQPIARQSLGLLEKKKDYKIRANYQHKKDNLLREYKLKAALKNPDEFNTRMISLARVGMGGMGLWGRDIRKARRSWRSKCWKRTRTRAF